MEGNRGNLAPPCALPHLSATSKSRCFRCFAARDARGLRHIVAAGDAKHPGSWRGDHSSADPAVGKFLLHKIRIDSQVWGISHLLFDLFEYSIQ